MRLFSKFSNLIGKQKPTFEHQFEVFKKLGFELNQGVDISDINRWPGGHKEFEDLPYIMKNISRISNGELIFEDVNDYVDIDEEVAWVSFTCNGDYYKWILKVDNDWVDEDLFDKVQELTDKYKTKRKFTYFLCL